MSLAQSLFFIISLISTALLICAKPTLAHAEELFSTLDVTVQPFSVLKIEPAKNQVQTQVSVEGDNLLKAFNPPQGELVHLSYSTSLDHQNLEVSLVSPPPPGLEVELRLAPSSEPKIGGQSNGWQKLIPGHPVTLVSQIAPSYGSHLVIEARSNLNVQNGFENGNYPLYLAFELR